MPTCAAIRTLRPTVTPWAICTRLSILVPALIRVSPTAGRSTVVFAPSSTSSSMTTVADLRNLLVRAVAATDEAVAVAADDDAILQDDAIAERDALADRHVRMDDAVGADARAGADGDVGIDNRAVADGRAFANGDKRTDRHVAADVGVGGDRRERIECRESGALAGAKRPTARAKAR